MPPSTLVQPDGVVIVVIELLDPNITTTSFNCGVHDENVRARFRLADADAPTVATTEIAIKPEPPTATLRYQSAT